MVLPFGYARGLQAFQQDQTNEARPHTTNSGLVGGPKEIVSEDLGEKSRVFTAQQLLDLDCNFDQCKFPKEEEEILSPAELLHQYHEKRNALDAKIDNTLSKIQDILGISIDKE